MKDIVLLGYSGSGKSTIANIICQQSYYNELHTIRPLYEFLANIYDVDVDWLMSVEGKASQCGDGDKTFHDVLVDLYLYHEKHRTNWGLNMLKKQVKEAMTPLIFTGIRNKNEFDFLIDHFDSDELKVYWLNPYWDVIQKESEHYLAKGNSRLKEKYNHTVYNILPKGMFTLKDAALDILTEAQ